MPFMRMRARPRPFHDIYIDDWGLPSVEVCPSFEVDLTACSKLSKPSSNNAGANRPCCVRVIVMIRCVAPILYEYCTCLARIQIHPFPSYTQKEGICLCACATFCALTLIIIAVTDAHAGGLE